MKLRARQFGVGSAVNNALRQIGSVTGAALCVALVGQSDANLASFRIVYGVLAVLGLAMAWSTKALPAVVGLM